MNSTNTPQYPDGTHDALFDRMERELHALTAASLDKQETTQGQCVDEFADELLGRFHTLAPLPYTSFMRRQM